ncbi:MAG: hypothetical protein AAF633_17110 [Chloroflexota bacterium]
MKDNDQLDRRIKQFYDSQSLPPELLAELKREIVKSRKNRFQAYMTQTYRYAAYTALLLVLMVGALFGVRRYVAYQQIQSMAAEIALNHAKRFNTEFSTPSIANLSSEMHLLDFAPVHPQKLRFETFDLLGARYCTIDSSIAVQIHMEDDGDEVYTLYQFRDPSPFLSNQERVIEVEDIQVTLWKEGEVVMGLAHAAADVR